jgi:hypothetical protein
MTDRCRCGAIRYESAGGPVCSRRCHSRDCRRESGSAFVVAARVPSAQFRIVKGAKLARSNAGCETAGMFCRDCGAPPYVQISTRPDLVGIRRQLR